MNKSKRNKKRVTKRRSKKNYVAKLIKLDKKGNTLVVFNKAVPKRVVKKVLNKHGQWGLCGFMSYAKYS